MRQYPPTDDSGCPDGRVVSVAPGPAGRAGLQAGDIIVAVNGKPVRDILDWHWLTAESSFSLVFMRDGERISAIVENDELETLGVSFASTLFEPMRQCRNACVFCFIAGLPKGLRRALYVRDDDYRLSFLNGNFVTLTNLTGEDVKRITTQRLSPLYVSVHAIDPDVRQRLMCSGEDSALKILDELLLNGIEVHTQIVLLPEVNDGGVLDETLEYLSERSGVLSVGVVPMGYTRHQDRWTSAWTPDTAVRIIEQIAVWQRQIRSVRGIGWVYPADEFYLLAGVPLPPVESYDDFPQYENGVGMAAAFVAEFREAYGRFRRCAVRVRRALRGRRKRFAGMKVVTGVLFAPVLRTVLNEAGYEDVQVLAVENTLLGGNVSVAGLLSGHDIVQAIISDGCGKKYLIPDVVVNSDGLLLDDVPASELGVRAQADVRIIGSDAKSLADALEKG